MFVRRLVPCLLAFGLSIPLAACGDDDRSGSGGHTNVPAHKSIGELTDEEATSLCKATEAAYKRKVSAQDQKNFTCTMVGVMFGGMMGGEDPVAGCEMYRTQCLESDEEFEEEAEDSCELDARAESCEVTVAEYQACINARVDAIGQLASTISCEMATDPEGIMDEPQACKVLEEKCPELFEDVPEEDDEDDEFPGNPEL